MKIAAHAQMHENPLGYDICSHVQSLINIYITSHINLLLQMYVLFLLHQLAMCIYFPSFRK